MNSYFILQKGLQKDNPILEIWGLPEVFLLEAKILASSSQAGLVTEWSTWLNGFE